MAWTERYVRADANGSGNGTTDANSGANGSWTIAQAISGVAAGHRVNVKAGTYANTTTPRTFSANGSAAAPIWWRGFRAAIGDLDALDGPRVAGVDLPEWTFTSGVVSLTGSYQTFQHLHMSGSAVGANPLINVNPGTAHIRLNNCRGINTTANASAYAVACVANGVLLDRCYFQASSTANRVVSHTAGNAHFIRTIAVGGVSGFYLGMDSGIYAGCIARNCGSDGFEFISGIDYTTILGCTSMNNGRDGIRFVSTVGVSIQLIDNLLQGNAGFGINVASGNAGGVLRVGNVFYGNASGAQNGFGDAVELLSPTDELAPVTLSNTNLALRASPLSTSIARRFEFDDYISYPDIGAVQRHELLLSPRTRPLRRVS